jgi:hypothetical protein
MPLLPDLKAQEFARCAATDRMDSVRGSSTIGKRRMRSPDDGPEAQVIIRNLSLSTSSESLREALCAAGVPAEA